jgi:hypothetical protein
VLPNAIPQQNMSPFLLTHLFHSQAAVDRVTREAEQERSLHVQQLQLQQARAALQNERDINRTILNSTLAWMINVPTERR